MLLRWGGELARGAGDRAARTADSIFASSCCSADGSVRVFDLRDKEHSTIIYESPEPDTPLLRLAWNKQVRPR